MTMLARIAGTLLRAALAVVAIPFALTLGLGRFLGVLGAWGGALMLYRRWDMPGQAEAAAGVLVTALVALVLVALAEAGWQRLRLAAGA